MTKNHECRPSRRDLLRSTACAFGSLALSGMTAGQSAAHDQLHQIAPRAKRVIFVFMQGGPSQVDTFDRKLILNERDGESIEFYNSRSMKVSPEKVLGTPWSFKKYGECGREVSELFPYISKCVDDICLIRSMHTEGVAHGPATLFLHTGATNLIRPSVGGWISYGLGNENQNLPTFVTINPPPTKGGPRNYGNAFLPAPHQATVISGRQNAPPVRYLNNEAISSENQSRQLKLLDEINQIQSSDSAHDDRLEATIKSYELAFRMQTHVPRVLEQDEPQHVLDMYGIGESETDEFGKQCLMARQMAEAGVRYIQVSYSDIKDTPKWDQHSNLKEHEVHALKTDKPVAGLLNDLKQRGLLDDTLIWWGGEFGRTPYSQNKDGRDHNPRGFSVWLAGGGVKPGFAYGHTDELGHHAIENKVHMHDLHATILHLLGIDHHDLIYRYAGRDFRLTDVHGRVVHDIIS